MRPTSCELLASNLLRFYWRTYDAAGHGKTRWENCDLSTLLHNLAVAGALATAAREAAADIEQAKRHILLQAARLRALESELATLQASVVAAMSNAGPAPEDERTT